MRVFNLPKVRIETYQRVQSYWVARLVDSPKTWESGSTEAEALFNLLITIGEEL